jgi:hypothetical protein
VPQRPLTSNEAKKLRRVLDAHKQCEPYPPTDKGLDDAKFVCQMYERGERKLLDADTHRKYFPDSYIEATADNGLPADSFPPVAVATDAQLVPFSQQAYFLAKSRVEHDSEEDRAYAEETITLHAIIERTTTLRAALEAIEAGADPTLSEARLILRVTRSRYARHFGGAYHYSDSANNDPYIVGGALIPEKAHLAAVKVEREQEGRKPRGTVHDYDLFRKVAEKAARDMNLKGKSLYRLKGKAIGRYNRQRQEQGAKTMKAYPEPARQIIKETQRKFQRE